MRNKHLLNSILQNTSCPKGFWGRMILWGMNRFHASLARRGMKQVNWQPQWTVLDIGCGGGANLNRLLKQCPQGKVYGIDLSEESVVFASKYNVKELNKRCFIQQGSVCSLPYKDGTFDAVTAFETVYFWSPIEIALAEVVRVLRKGGCFLVGLEASSPELGKMWTERIKGMVVYTAGDLKDLLIEAGFSTIQVVHNKEEMYMKGIGMNAIKNITIGHTKRLCRPVGLTVLANLINIVPFCFSIEAVRIVFNTFDGSGRPLDTVRLWYIFGVMACYMIVMALAERASYRSNFRGAYEMSASGRLSLAEHLRKLSLGFLSQRDPGDLSSMLITDFSMAETGISHHLPQLMGAVVMPVLAFASLIWIDWRMAVAMFAALPLALFILWVSTSVQKKLSGSQVQAKINAGSRFEEYLQGIRVVKAYNLLGAHFDRLRDAFAELRRACIRQEAQLGPFVLLSIALVRAGLTLMVLCGTYLLLSGDLSLPIFILFLVVGSRVFDPLTSALTNFAEFRYFSIAGGRILTLMDEPEMRGELQSPVTGDIRFEHVSFAYRDKEVLHDVSITLSKNSLTALVGPSGSGKSTVMKLCARFYDPQKGRVFFGDLPMDKINPESLMSHISMVFQDVYLFQDTVRNNIRFGKAGATDDEIIVAAQKACCHDFIMQLPQGYDTMIGEGGCTLSGGEKQRISIARAVLKDAQVILLDEATASLDPENEVEMQKAIDTLIKGRTVITIAHKLKTIMNANRIIVLDDGQVKEQGTHDELIRVDGLYARLWKIQESTSGWNL